MKRGRKGKKKAATQVPSSKAIEESPPIVDDAVPQVPEVETAEKPPEVPAEVKSADGFVWIDEVILSGKLTVDRSAYDLPGTGAIIRAVFYDDERRVINATEYFVPNVALRDGRLVRSLR